MAELLTCNITIMSEAQLDLIFQVRLIYILLLLAVPPEQLDLIILQAGILFLLAVPPEQLDHEHRYIMYDRQVSLRTMVQRFGDRMNNNSPPRLERRAPQTKCHYCQYIVGIRQNIDDISAICDKNKMVWICTECLLSRVNE